MAGKGQDRATLARIGAKTRFKKGGAVTKKAAAKSAAVRTAKAAIRSADRLLQADQDGTIAELLDGIFDELKMLRAEGKHADYIKHASWLMEMVNGRQVNIKADANVKRDIIINFRRATPEDAK